MPHKKIEWEQEARRLKASGMTYQQVADEIGVSRQRIQQAMKIHGVPREGICEKCKMFSPVLHCHHLNYLTDDFEILCPTCHRKTHGLDLKTSEFWNEPKTELGRKIKAWQLKSRLNNFQAARKLEIPLRTYMDWKCGSHSPRGFALKAISNLLNAL